MNAPAVVLDHVAVGARALDDGWDLFGGLLGGRWAYGGDSRGFWWGQLQYSDGPKVELLTPTGGPDSAFLERFLADRGPGVHHLNFIVPSIGATLEQLRDLGVEPVGVRLEDPRWKEAFLHPRDAYGTVIQVAQQAGASPNSGPPAGLDPPRRACALSLIEMAVPDVEEAARLFCAALGGQVAGQPDGPGGGLAVEIGWGNGALLRLAPADGEPGVTQLEFTPQDSELDAAEAAQADVLARRLGVSLRIGDLPADGQDWEASW